MLSKRLTASWTVWLNVAMLVLPDLIAIFEKITESGLLPETWHMIALRILAVLNILLRVFKTSRPIRLPQLR